MSTTERSVDAPAAASGSARLLVAYLVTVAVANWLFVGVGEVTNGQSGRVPGLAAALANALGPGLAALVVVFAVLLVPAMVLTIELVRRSAVTVRLGRAALGAALWAGWGLFVALSLSVLSRVVLLSEILIPDLLVLAAAGAVFPVLALRAEVQPVGRALTLTALVVAATVLVGSVVLSGLWGAAT